MGSVGILESMQQFPKGFLWGASTSAMQVEGGIENNDWAEAVRQGLAPTIGLACNHYHRYEEDFDSAKSLNHTAHRFSIEWARVEPEEGKFDSAELEHYKNVVKSLRARGMEPFVTVWHFSLPLWFVKSGSFGRKDAPAIFARYAAKVAEVFGDQVTFYMTMNEPLVWLGEHGKILNAAPGFGNPVKALRYFTQLVRAHHAAYVALKAVVPHAKVGVAKHQFSVVATNPLGAVVAHVFRFLWNRHFLNAIRHHQDFIGIQYYQRLFFWQSKKESESAEKSDIGWQLHPSAIYDTLKEASRYGVPLYVTEAGIADRRDQRRAWYIEETIAGIRHAVDEGVDVRGFFYWSLLDNYEFKEGFSMRFGLVHVEHAGSLIRTIRDSARAYAEIITTSRGE